MRSSQTTLTILWILERLMGVIVSAGNRPPAAITPMATSPTRDRPLTKNSNGVKDRLQASRNGKNRRKYHVLILAKS